jgi:branched-subunit amino acid ABC-type transport system permease component
VTDPVLAASTLDDFIQALLQGIPIGAVYALIAVGFVLTYKTSGVFNLAFGAQAFASAAMYFELHIRREWPIWAALLVSVFVLAPLIGLVLERLIFRRLRGAPASAKLVVTIGLAVAIPELVKLALDFGREPSFGAVGIVPDGAIVYQFLGEYPISRNEIAQIVVAIVGALLLAALFRYTSLGLKMRAVVESPRMTELAGVDADRVSAFSWALSSTFAGLAGVLLAPRFANLDQAFFFELVVVAIAAAALGRLISLPMALFGGLLLGIVNIQLATFLPREGSWSILKQNLGPSLPFVVLFLIIVLWPAISRQRDAGDPLSGVDPPPPALAAITRSHELTVFARVVGGVVLGGIALWAFTGASDFWLLLLTRTVIYAVIFLSITVFTGFTGDIPLSQAAFAAIGGFTTMQLADRWDVNVLAGLVVGVLIAAAVGALLAVPVLRLAGIWLSLATLAFALFFDSVLVKFSWVNGQSLQEPFVPRPLIGPIDFGDSDRAYLALCIVFFAVVATIVVLLREGTTGQRLRALRGSELAAASIGISAARARILTFMLSAGVAAVGGSLLAMQNGRVGYDANYRPFIGLFWIVLVVVMGTRTVEGAGWAAAAFILFPVFILDMGFNPPDFITDLPIIGWVHETVFPLDPAWRFVFFGFAAVSFAKHPEGVLEAGKRRNMARMQVRLDRYRARRAGDSGPADLDGPGGATDAAAPSVPTDESADPVLALGESGPSAPSGPSGSEP